MPKSVTVPSTLSGHAAKIWRKTFLSAYSGTCSERDDKDECAAKIAWSAVKKQYKKKGDAWVAKAGDPIVGPISTDIDKQPSMAYPKDSVRPGTQTEMARWKDAYMEALKGDCRHETNPEECARAYANKAIGRAETEVEPVEKVLKGNGRVIKRMVERGGPGSGHHGHRGRPGEVGGSLPSGGKGGFRILEGDDPSKWPSLDELFPDLADPVVDKETGFRKSDQVEISWDKDTGEIRYREVRWKDDPTARWINEQRARDIIGDKLFEAKLNQAEGERIITLHPPEKGGAGSAGGDPYDPLIDWTVVPDVGAEGEVVEPYQRTAQEKAMDGRRRHKFITKEIEKKLPPLYSQQENPDPTVHAKWFHPFATQEFYATEYDPVEGIFFGWVNSRHEPELTYFSRQELAEANVRGVPIERDLYFDPKPLSEVRETAKRQIPPEEYAFRLESTLRGEEKTMDEHPLKKITAKMRDEVMADYTKRRDVRQRLNEVDYALIDRMGDQEIIRPDRFSTITWRTMPPSQKNVRSEATRRIIERNYAQAVEDAQVAGWKAKKNHYQPDEFYFVKPHDTDQGRVIMRAVLVRHEDSVDWELKILSQFATESIAIQLPKELLRHTKEQLLKLPVLRGGPGSGHHGHRGRPGEVGGSLPAGDSGSAGRQVSKPKEHIQPSIDWEAGDIPETDEELYEMLEAGDLDKPAEPQLSERISEMSISQIAREVRKDWGNKVNFAAKPYLDAMGSLEKISDNYMFDSGVSVVSYFLANAGQWRGDTARMVKAELKKRLKAGR